jgi:hypothetical protein
LWNTHRKPLWTGTLGKSTLKLKKACRPTGDAVAIFKTPPGGKETQILQILLDKFDGDQDAKRASGVALGTSLCERLASGTLKESALKEARDREQRGRAPEADAASSGAAPDTGAAPKRRWSSQVRGPGHKRPAEEPLAAPRKRPAAAPRKRPAAEEAPEDQKQEEEEEDQGDEEEEAAEEEKQKEKEEEEAPQDEEESIKQHTSGSPEELQALLDEMLAGPRLPDAGRLELDEDLPSPDNLHLSDLEDAGNVL